VAKISAKPADIQKSVRVIGISLTQKEIADLNEGKVVSIESCTLGEIGSLLLRVDALLATKGKGFSIGELWSISSTSQTNGCQGIEIVEIDDKCSIYYQFPFSMQVCCKS
jgi:hypothetical protein